MADVIDIIHNLKYTVDDNDLAVAQQTLTDHVSAIFALAEQLAGLGAKQKAASGADARVQADIRAAIEGVATAIDKQMASMEKLVEGNKKLATAMKQMVAGQALANKALTTSQTAAEKTGKAMQDLTTIVAAAPTSLEAIAGSIVPLVKGMKQISDNANAAGHSIGTELLGALKGGDGFMIVLNIATTLLAAFGSKIIDAITGTKALTAAQKAEAEMQKAANQEAAGEIGRLGALHATITNLQLPLNQRLQAVKDLQREFPTYFANLSQEAILNDKVAAAYKKTTDAIIASAKLKVLEDKLGPEAIKQDKLQATYDREFAEHKRSGGETDKVYDYINKETYEVPAKNGLMTREMYDATENLRRQNMVVNDFIEQIQEAQKLLGYKPPEEHHYSAPRVRPEIRMVWPDELAAQEKHVEAIKRLGAFLEKKELEDAKKEGYVSLEHKAAAYSGMPEEKKLSKEDQEKLEDQMFHYEIDKKKKKLQDEEDEKAKQNRIKRIQDVKNAYLEMTSAIVSALTTIYEAQKKQLDEEIKIRERRVEEATVLAERGNADALRMEKERLEAAYREKEKIARREAQLNSALTLSNSLVAVTGAISNAVKGDPYTVAARVAAAIAAVLAALSAGYSFVKSFDKPASFSEGGYTGHGGVHEAAGTVHKGEVVWSQKDIARAGGVDVVERMRTMQQWPVLVTRDVAGISHHTDYASKKELNTLNQKMDQLIEATQGNSVRVNQHIDRNGVHQLVETARHMERVRWR